MRVLRDDVFMRTKGGRRRRRPSGVVVFALILLSLALLVLSRIDHPVIRQVRAHTADLLAPILDATATALSPLRRLGDEIAILRGGADEVERLRAQVRQLGAWEARARELERQLADLSSLARVVHEPSLAFVTGRVVADAGGPIARSVLITAGRDHGLRAGYPVINGDGVVGRVLEAGRRSARLLLLTDLNSRIPVIVGNAGVNAILTGDNGGVPRLRHVPAGATLAPGDQVVTSGIGGLFPRGLRVGVVRAGEGGLDVVLHARLTRLDYVSVLIYGPPALDLDEPQPKVGEAPRRRTLAGQPGTTPSSRSPNAWPPAAPPPVARPSVVP